jgi:hypothetical protein
MTKKSIKNEKPTDYSRRRATTAMCQVKEKLDSSDGEFSGQAPSPEKYSEIQQHQMESYPDLRASMQKLNSSSEGTDLHRADHSSNHSLPRNPNSTMRDIGAINNQNNFSMLIAGDNTSITNPDKKLPL